MVSLKKGFFGCVLISFITIVFLGVLSINASAADCCKGGVVVHNCNSPLGPGESWDLSGCNGSGGIPSVCEPGVVDSSKCSGYCPAGSCELMRDCTFRCWSTGGGPACVTSEVDMSKCRDKGITCLPGQKCRVNDDCKYSCFGDAIPTCTAAEVEMSKCRANGVTCLFGQRCNQRENCSYFCSGSGAPVGCMPGATKYEPKGSCATATNTCCSNGKWAGFGVACPNGEDLCTSSECWDGTSCADKPSTACTCVNGTCSKSYLCNSGRGWSSGITRCTCYNGYTSESISGPCYKEEVVKQWSCRVAGSGECNNPVNNRHSAPCQSLLPTCSMVGEKRAYYSCQTCYTCTCESSTIRPALP